VARFSLIPKDGRFFDDFIHMAQVIDKGSAVLVDMLAGDTPRWTARISTRWSSIWTT
jgi:hypothetical protein